MGTNILNKQFTTLESIQELVWVRVLKELPTDLSKIPFRFDDFEDVESWKISYEDFLRMFSFIKESDFANLKKENIWENVLFEVYKTYLFLNSKFWKSKERLFQAGFYIDDLLESVLKRLVEQVLEAWNWQRKLKNGNVVWLSSYNSHWFVFEKIPYYAFASTNVSLDLVKVKNKNDWNEYTLRDIDTILNSQNDNWWFFLPNSMWVSINLMTTYTNWNLVFIAQERNNSTTLTQRWRFVSSASWAVDYETFSNWWHLWLLNTAIASEVEEELWINPLISNISKDTILQTVEILDQWDHYKAVKSLWDLLSQEWHMILWRELWLDANFMPVALVMEEKRRNPEFIFLWKVWYTIEQVQQAWQDAEWKDESLSIVWISYQEVLEELNNRKNLWIQQIDNHFLMSYIWYLIKTWVDFDNYFFIKTLRKLWSKL